VALERKLKKSMDLSRDQNLNSSRDSIDISKYGGGRPTPGLNLQKDEILLAERWHSRSKLGSNSPTSTKSSLSGFITEP